MILSGLLLILAFAMLIYMAAWFVFGFLYLKRLDSLDSAWGLGFVYLAVISLVIMDNYKIIPLLSLLLVSIWGIRLFVHITARNMKKQEDVRYAVYRKKFANNLNASVFTRLYLTQGALILLISTASVAAIISDDFIQPLAIAGLVVWTFGIFYEAVADLQLSRFIRLKTGKIMTGGLWKYSRHPNYFGEITAWSGAGIVAASAGQYWGLIGPIVITYLLTRVSGIPLIEEKYKNDKSYQAYKKTTSVLIPLPPKH